MNLLICYYNVDKLTTTMIDNELGRMESKLKELAEAGTKVIVVPVRNQKTKIETIYIPVSIDKLLEED